MTVEGGPGTAPVADVVPPPHPDRIVQPVIADHRPRWRRLLAPAAAASAVVAGCAYLFATLPTQTHLFFLAAQAIGILVYFTAARLKWARRQGGVSY